MSGQSCQRKKCHLTEQVVQIGMVLTLMAAGKQIKSILENENVVQTGGGMEKCMNMINAENKGT